MRHARRRPDVPPDATPRRSRCAAHTRLRWRSSMRRTTARRRRPLRSWCDETAALGDLVERAQRVVELHDVQLLKLVEHRPVLAFRRGVLRIVLEDLEPATVQSEVDATAAERAVEFQVVRLTLQPAAVMVAMGASGSMSATAWSTVGRRCGPNSVTLTRRTRAPSARRRRACRAGRRSRGASSGCRHWPYSPLPPVAWAFQGRQVRVDHPFTRPGLNILDAGVSGDLPVAIGSERDDPAGEPSRRTGADAAVDDGIRPLEVDVDVVAGRVEVPGADAGRAAADLGEAQPLRSEEPPQVALVPMPSASFTRWPSSRSCR